MWAFISLAAPADDLLERAAAEVLPRVTWMFLESALMMGTYHDLRLEMVLYI